MTPADTTVLVDRDVAEELFSYIKNKTTDLAEDECLVPASHLTSPTRAAAEIELMKRLPLVAGHICEIKEPGDFITREILGLPIIMVRQKDGSVATFRNMCRHRGGVVETEPSGNKRSFMCQYHGWTYAAEGGDLKRLVYEDTWGPIDYACNGLIRIKTEIYHGLIYINFAGEGPSVAEFLGPGVESQVAPWGLERAVILIDKKMTLPMNWKLVMDGAIDPLHPPFLHPKPGGVGERTVPVSVVFRNYGPHGKMFGPRKKILKLIEENDVGATSSKHVGSVMQLYPNSIYVVAPDHVEFWTVLPTPGKPGESTTQIRFFVRPEILTPEMEKRVHKSWDILEIAAVEEDFPMEMAIQKNAEAYPDSILRYGRNEKPTQNLHRQLMKDIGPDA